MRTMMITLLIDAEQGEAILALVQEDAISCVHAYVEEQVAEIKVIESSRAGSSDKHKGVNRAFHERILGIALIEEMHGNPSKTITKADAERVALVHGYREGSGPTYMNGMTREGVVETMGPRRDRSWRLIQ